MTTTHTGYNTVMSQQRVVDGVGNCRRICNSAHVDHDIVGMFSDDDNEDGDIEQEARRAAHQKAPTSTANRAGNGGTSSNPSAIPLAVPPLLRGQWLRNSAPKNGSR